MKTIKIISACCAAAATLGWSACMDTDAQYTVVDTPAPTFTGVICNENDTVFASGNALATGMQLYPGIHTISVMFDENIGFATSTKDQITLNGNPVSNALVYGASNLLTIEFTSPAVSELVLTIPAGLVYGPSRKTNEQEITISWTSINVAPATALVNAEATSEAKALYQTLLANYGQKILSGTMANVNWNNDNAEQVYRWTGKYPAINCYDFIHLPFDGTWIHYSDMTPVATWHNGGGIVAAMWHWNVPSEEPVVEPTPQPGGDETILSNEEKVMPSDWSGWYKIEANLLASLKEGDVITAHTKDVAAGAQGSFKDGSSWSGLVDGNGTSYEYFDITGDFSLTLDATLLAAIQANGLIISGHDYTLTGVTANTASASGQGDETVLSSDEKVMPSDWSGWYKIEATALANAKEGDVITAHTKDVAAGAQGSFKDGSSWSGLVDGNGTSYEYFDITGDFSITLDATLLAAIQANGLIISGHDYTLTGVTLSSNSAAPQRAKKDDIQYVIHPDQTTFMPSNCLVEGTWENKVWNDDLAKVAGYLKTMQEMGIAVIWRPFHEAKGNYDVYQAGTGAWFWWGKEGPEVCKHLWIAMYDYMKAQGVNNLIWVWTDIPTSFDPKWYPGDQYVDMVGADIYNQTDAAAIASTMQQLQYLYPNKMVTLSECGGVADAGAQFEAGATWSWFMPWYEGEGTAYAPMEWWQNVMNSPHVITRDMLK